MRETNSGNGRSDLCSPQKACFFCQMPAELTKDLIVGPSVVYKVRTTLFAENEASRGAFILCEGEAKITMNSRAGKTLILGIGKSGEILGLLGILSGKVYRHTAETITPCRIRFVRREDFLRFVTVHPQALEPIVRQLSANYEAACEQLRIIGLAPTASAKLARLLLEGHSYAERSRRGDILHVHLTHEEIGEFIGACRETVTRTLNEFKERKLVHIDSTGVVISNRAGLEAIVAA